MWPKLSKKSKAVKRATQFQSLGFCPIMCNTCTTSVRNEISSKNILKKLFLIKRINSNGGFVLLSLFVYVDVVIMCVFGKRKKIWVTMVNSLIVSVACNSLDFF